MNWEKTCFYAGQCGRQIWATKVLFLESYFGWFWVSQEKSMPHCTKSAILEKPKIQWTLISLEPLHIAQDVSLFGAKFGQPTLLPPCHGACDNAVWEAVGRWCLAWLSFVLYTLYRRCCKGGVWVSLYSVLCSLFGRRCEGGVWVSWLQPEPIIWRAVCWC